MLIWMCLNWVWDVNTLYKFDFEFSVSLTLAHFLVVGLNCFDQCQYVFQTSTPFSAVKLLSTGVNLIKKKNHFSLKTACGGLWNQQVSNTGYWGSVYAGSCWCAGQRERGRKLPHAAVKHWLMRPVTCCGQYFSIHLKSPSKQFPIYMFPARCTVQCVRSDKDEGAVFQPLPPSPGVWTGSCTDLKILDGKKKKMPRGKKKLEFSTCTLEGKKNKCRFRSCCHWSEAGWKHQVATARLA